MSKEKKSLKSNDKKQSQLKSNIIEIRTIDFREKFKLQEIILHFERIQSIINQCISKGSHTHKTKQEIRE